MTIHLNHRQCRQARGLLKWNSQDLSGRTKLGAKRIEAYERGITKLETFEIRDLYEAFTEAGLVFTSTKVEFKKKPREKHQEQPPLSEAEGIEAKGEIAPPSPALTSKPVAP